MPGSTPATAKTKISSNELGKSKKPLIRRAWGAKRRALHAHIARRTRLWMHSTGPRTAAGKAKSAGNAYKSGTYCAQKRALSRLLTRQGRYVRAAHRLGIYPPGLHAEGLYIIIQLRRALNAVNLWP